MLSTICDLVFRMSFILFVMSASSSVWTKSYSFEQAIWQTWCHSETFCWMWKLKAGPTNVWDNVILPPAGRSQPLLPVDILHYYQSICKFFVRNSSSDIVILEIGRVLKSGDWKVSNIWIATQNTSRQGVTHVVRHYCQATDYLPNSILTI
jgi:hypothetical protein